MKDRTRISTFIPLALILLIICSSSSLFAQFAETLVARPADALTAPLDQPVPASPAVRTGMFANGLRYFIRENEEPENRAELRLVVNAGSVLEDEDQRGLAHFLEHMAFNGTENFEKQELVGFMESIGMRLGPGLNAGTSFDETFYELRLPTDNPDYMATAFQIMEDWAQALTLDPEEVELERGVVIEEWRLRRGAGTRLQEQQFPVLFNESRYAERTPIGTLESLETFDREALVRFYRDWYRPNLMAVIAVGDFDANTIEGLVRHHFEGLSNPENPRARPVYRVPYHAETLFSIATDPEVTGTQLQVYHMLPRDDDWTIGGYRRRIIEGLYNGMMNNRFGEIALQPDPPFLRASSSLGGLLRSLGAYVLSASVLEGGIEGGLAAVLTEAERVARFGFTASELERQKSALLRSMEQSYANRTNRDSGAFAREYIRAFLNGESIPGIEYEYALHQRFVPEISIEEVNRAGRDWIQETNRVVLVSAPRREGQTMPSEATLATVLAGVSGIEISAYEDTLGDRTLLAEVPVGSEVVVTRTLEGGITEWELANGVRVVLQPTDFDQEEIVFRAFSPGGTSLAADEDFIPASTAATLVSNSGVGDFSSTDLEKVLAGKIASVRPFISTYDEGLSGRASTSDLETLFQLVYLWFEAPRADEAIFQLWSAQTRQALENRDANPLAAFSDAYTRIINQNHPRGRPPTLDILEQADLDRSLAFYKERFSDAGNFTFIFVGDLDPGTMRPLVERYLGGLPATRSEETWRDIGMRPPAGVIEETVYRGIEPQSQTRLAFTGPFDYADQAERTGIRAMAMTLQTRLSDRLREELGGTYSIRVGANIDWRPEGSYTLSISFGSDPERVEELLASLYEEIEVMKSEGPTEGQVSDTRQALLRSFETDFQENRTLLAQLESDYQRGAVPGASLRSYVASVEALTPTSIRDDARQYINMENRVRVTLLPEQ